MKKLLLLIMLVVVAVHAADAPERIKLPSAATLQQRFSGSFLEHFAEKTGIVSKLAGQKLPLDEIVSIVVSTSCDYKTTQGWVTARVVKERAILKIVLQNHPQAFEKAMKLFRL